MVLLQHAIDFEQECSFRKNFNPCFGPLSKDLTMHKCNTYIFIARKLLRYSVNCETQKKQKTVTFPSDCFVWKTIEFSSLVSPFLVIGYTLS